MKGLWYWRPLYVVAVPLALLPVYITLPSYYPDAPQSVFSCLYAVCWTVLYWIAEVVPLPVTAFLPLILFPFFGILKGSQLALTYFKDTNFVLMGSFMMAAAFEESHLDKRIALRILLTMGSDPRWLILGFLVAGGVLSMWLVNAAVVAMLLPPAFAIINELTKFSHRTRSQDPDNIISLAHMGTLKREVEAKQDEEKQKDTPKDFTAEEVLKSPRSMLYPGPSIEDVPVRDLLLVEHRGNGDADRDSADNRAPGTPEGPLPQLYRDHVRQVVLLRHARGHRRPRPRLPHPTPLHSGHLPLHTPNLPEGQPQEPHKEAIPRTRYIIFSDIEVMCIMLFCLLFLDWFFRDPGFPNFSGWVSLFAKPGMITIGTSTMAIAVLLFIVPKEAPWSKAAKPQRAILTWPFAQRKIPWGILLLVGGGYAMADGIQASGLSAWIGQRLEGLETLSPFILMFIGVCMAGVMTEFTSNVVVVEVFVPILGSLAEQMGLNPLYLILGTVLKSSFAFMLPVATPPNAIIFSFGLIKVASLPPFLFQPQGVEVYHMMGIGLLMNLMCVGVILVQIQYYGTWLFTLDSYPSWAPALVSTTHAFLLNSTTPSPLTTLNHTL